MRYFVRNITNKPIREVKPGIGVFFFSPGEELEIEAKLEETTLPTKEKILFVRNTAKDIAESLVNDFGAPGLELIVRDEVEELIEREEE